jgi:hydroxymethylglutaryl-CoA reductase
MPDRKIVEGFSKLSKGEKIRLVAQFFPHPQEIEDELLGFQHIDPHYQKLFDEFSENTLSNFYMPFGIAPNMRINGHVHFVPMVIEESSVVAAASNSGKYWLSRGGFHARVISTRKIGQVHFTWPGRKELLLASVDELQMKIISNSAHITHNMVRRGGGITSIELVDMTGYMTDYYQLKATFETVDSMGANFINSCLEDFAATLRQFLAESSIFSEDEREVEIIMSILSNYTPDCLVEAYVECPISELTGIDENLSPEQFAQKFSKAVRVAQIDTYRATTHNKGIFNGIDAVVLATGNDFRAVEACGHTFASRNGRYSSLTDVSLDDGIFRYTLKVPLALGTVGGLTRLHPLSKFSLELLGNPNAEELMQIAAVTGLANNFAAIKSLTTKGIQVGHMKMHLINILNHFQATDKEKNMAIEYFKSHKVSVNAVRDLIGVLRKEKVH